MSDRSNDISELVRFAIDMGEDPKKVAAFKKDPESFLAGSNLSEESRALVLAAGKEPLAAAEQTRTFALHQTLPESQADTTVVVVVAVAVA